MDEFNSAKKNDNLKQILDNFAEITGGGLGAALGFLAGDPLMAAFASTAGITVAGLLKNIGQEFSKRQLSPQEDFRVGKVLAIATFEIHQLAEVLK